MMCNEIVEKYFETLKGEFRCIKGDEYIRIITPYLYPDNDLIEIFIQESPDHILVTDLGETLRHLHSQGFDIFSTAKRKFLFETITSRANVQTIQGELRKETAPDTLGEAIYDIIGASKALGDLIYTSIAYEPVFIQEVEAYLKENDIRYETNIPVIGVTGKKYRINFKIFNHQESLMEILSPKSKSGIKLKVDATFRTWYDIDKQARKVSILNDMDFEWKEPDIRLLQNVSEVVFWSKKERILELYR